MHTFSWLGSSAPHLSTPAITTCGRVVIGKYGGNAEAGASKNEDAALVWCESAGNSSTDNSWEFAVILDAHGTAQSAALVLETLKSYRDQFVQILSQPAYFAFTELQNSVFNLFNSQEFREEARHIYGETSVLMCARKSSFVWWFCVGDCLLYLLHPDLARLGQFMLNQRSFYEWIGRANVFDLAVPCYASGVRELRSGQNTLVMLTDGVLTFGSRPFEDPELLYAWFTERGELADSVYMALMEAHDGRGRDSATLIAWTVDNPSDALRPST